MTRQQAERYSDNLVDIMTEIEDRMLKEIAAQLGRDKNLSDTSKWRIRQLARRGQLSGKNLQLIKSYSGLQSDVLGDTLLNAALEEIRHVDEGMKAAIGKGLIGGDTDIPADRTAINALDAYYKQAESDLNMVNTVMQYQASDAYAGAVNNIYFTAHHALDTGTASVVLGDTSLQTAIRSTIADLSKKGIAAFVDRAGRHWSPESYVRMDITTTLSNTARAAQWARCDDYGVDLIAVDSHMGARPLCAPYQGKIYSRGGSSGVVTDIDGRKIPYAPLSSTSYGKPAGLFGINCGHSSYPFIPGISVQMYFPHDPEENAARYKEFQTQRYLERSIRASKRECMMLQAAGDDEGYKKAAVRLKTNRDKYKAYSNAHGLSLRNDRTQVYGYDRSQSMKAVWADKKAKKGGGKTPSPSKSPKSGGSGGHAVAVNVPSPADNGGTGKIYQNLSLTNSGGSGMINNRNCVIHPNKVNKFFLKPGAKHSKEFFDVGYTVNDGDKLVKDLSEIFDYSKAVDKSVSKDGIEKFSIFAELGVSEKKRFRTVWQKDTPDSEPRIITAHRED